MRLSYWASCLFFLAITTLVLAEQSRESPRDSHLVKLARLIASYVALSPNSPAQRILPNTVNIANKNAAAPASPVMSMKDDSAEDFLALSVNDNTAKRYDDYGHMRYGKRSKSPDPDDYGSMRFGKRSVGEEDYGHWRFGKRSDDDDDYGSSRFGQSTP